MKTVRNKIILKAHSAMIMPKNDTINTSGTVVEEKPKKKKKKFLQELLPLQYVQL